MRFAVLLGLVADTHIPEAGPDIWPQVYDRFRAERVDAILHGGDIHILEVLDRLEQRVGVPVYACRGNGDDGGAGRPVVPDDPRLREGWLLTWHGFRVGLCHDMALPEQPPHRTVDTMAFRYFGGPADVIVYGDTHVPEVEVIRGTLLINPGSPMFPRNMNTSLGTIGFLRLEDDLAEAWVEPLHPEHGPTLRDGGVTQVDRVADHYPDQWVIFAVHGHNAATGVSHGSVLEAGFAVDEARTLERAIRRRDASAILLTFHTSAPPPFGAAQRIPRPAAGNDRRA
jgi:putative phosphoesterase